MASTDQFLPVDSEQHDRKQPKDPEKGMQALSVIEPPADAPEPLMDRIEARLPGATRTQKWTTVGIGAALLFLLSALGWRTFASKHKGPCPDGYEEVGQASGRRLMEKSNCVKVDTDNARQQLQAHLKLLRQSQTKSAIHNFQAQTDVFRKKQRKPSLPAAARGSSAYRVPQVNANGQTQLTVHGLTPTRSSALAFSPYQSFDSTQAATTFNSDQSGMYQTQASQYFSVQGGPRQAVQETGRFPDPASNHQYTNKLGSTQADLRIRLKEWSRRKHVNNDLFQVELEYWSNRQTILKGQMEAVLELETKFNEKEVQTTREGMRDAFTNAQQMMQEVGFDPVFSEKILKRFKESQQWEVVLFARATLAALWAVHAAAAASHVDQTSKIQDQTQSETQSLVFALSFDTADESQMSLMLSDTARNSEMGSPYLQSDQVQVKKLSAQIEKCSTLVTCAEVWEAQEWQQLPVDKDGIHQYYAVLQQWQAKMYKAILANLWSKGIQNIPKAKINKLNN